MPQIVLAISLGALLWSFMEYVIHRGLGHVARTRPNPFANEHVRHHSEGHYFAPSWKKALAAVAFTGLLCGPAVWVGGAGPGLAFVLGFVGAYLGYEVVHRRDHTRAGATRYGVWLRRHHFSHHFTDPKFNHGVTSPVWDWVFGTRRAPGVVRVPEKLAMPWLLEPATGAVRERHRKHYELIPARR